MLDIVESIGHSSGCRVRSRVIDRDSKERAGHILSREAVGGGADLKANEV